MVAGRVTPVILWGSYVSSMSHSETDLFVKIV